MKLAWLFPIVLLSGCAQDEYSDLKAFMAQTNPGGGQALEPLPPVKPQDTFNYDPNNLPDPFRPRNLKPAKAGGALQPDVNRPKEPLEQYPLDGLHMVGTINKGGQLFALVRTPDNTLYRVKKGEHMGQNYGLVTAISDTNIEIKEIVQDGAGDWTEAKAALALQE